MDSKYREKKIQEDKYKKSLKKAISKGDSEMVKTIRTEQSLKPVDKERTRYRNENEYLNELKEKIITLEKKRIDNYYDIFYDLQDNMEEYDMYKADLDKLKRQYENLLRAKTEREDKKRSEHYRILNEINENIAIYKFMEIADKKESYLKIRELGEKLLEKNISILPTMEEGTLIYRSIINYEPPVDIKI
jgi:hypothetical protein